MLGVKVCGQERWFGWPALALVVAVPFRPEVPRRAAWQGEEGLPWWRRRGERASVGRWRVVRRRGLALLVLVRLHLLCKEGVRHCALLLGEWHLWGRGQRWECLGRVGGGCNCCVRCAGDLRLYPGVLGVPGGVGEPLLLVDLLLLLVLEVEEQFRERLRRPLRGGCLCGRQVVGSGRLSPWGQRWGRKPG